jgi:class 3 adenylate cyclase
LNEELGRELGVHLGVRTGVNTGEAVVGDAESGQFFAAFREAEVGRSRSG